MSDGPMVLQIQDIERIGDYIKPWIGQYVDDRLSKQQEVQTQLLERMLHVEEEIKLQRVFMDERFKAVDQRFESMDKRFEAMQESMEKRFEAVDKRFDDMQRSFGRTQWLIGGGLALLTIVVTVFGLL